MGVAIASLFPKKEIKLEDLKNKVVGIDFFNVTYQFLSSIRSQDGSLLQDSQGRTTSHLMGLFTRSLNLMSRGLKLVYVIDGEAPELKNKERALRLARKERAKEKYDEAVDEEDLEAMHKFSKQFIRLDNSMLKEGRELLEALGMPVIQAPSEAEAQIAFMNKNGDVWCTASQDADSLLFGSPKLVKNLTLTQKRKLPGGKTVNTFIELIELKDLLSNIGINQDQLIVLGILTGTDFNPGGVKGIGPKKALKLIKEEKDFGIIFSKFETNFDWKEIFNLFKKDIKTTSNYKLIWNNINIEKVKNILVKEHDFNEARVLSLIEKYQKENKDIKQKGLNEFF